MVLLVLLTRGRGVFEVSGYARAPDQFLLADLSSLQVLHALYAGIASSFVVFAAHCRSSVRAVRRTHASAYNVSLRCWSCNGDRR